MAESFNGMLPLDYYVNTWIDRGVIIGKGGRQLAVIFNSESVSAEFDAFLQEMPVALKNAAVGLVRAAGAVVQEIIGQAANAAKKAAWGTAQIVLVIGAALAGAFFLLKKSGVSIGIGPVRLNAYGKYDGYLGKYGRRRS
jgi:hypothetical protein